MFQAAARHFEHRISSKLAVTKHPVWSQWMEMSGGKSTTTSSCCNAVHSKLLKNTLTEMFSPKCYPISPPNWQQIDQMSPCYEEWRPQLHPTGNSVTNSNFAPFSARQIDFWLLSCYTGAFALLLGWKSRCWYQLEVHFFSPRQHKTLFHPPLASRKQQRKSLQAF